MRNGTIFLMVLCALLFCGAAGPFNLVINPDFEAGSTFGWGAWAVKEDVVMTENHSSGGLFCLRLSLSGKEGGPFSAGALIQEKKVFKENEKVYASAWVKTDNLRGKSGNKVYAFIKLEFWKDGTLIDSAVSEKLTEDNGWTFLKIDTIVPEFSNMTKLLLMLENDGGKDSTGYAYFDDVHLGKTPAPVKVKNNNSVFALK